MLKRVYDGLNILRPEWVFVEAYFKAQNVAPCAFIDFVGDYGIVITHFAVPFGDMMMTGCFGLLAAVADVLPVLAEPIRSSLVPEGNSGRSPWEIS